MLVIEQAGTLQNIGFTAQDLVKLTDLSYDQVRYLSRENIGLIKPIRENRKKAPAYYSFTHLVEIRAISDLRNQGASLQKIRKAKNYLLDTVGNADLRDKAFLIMNNELHIIKNDPETRSSILEQVTGSGTGQLIISGLVAVSSVLEELDQTANVIGFDNWVERRKIWEAQLAV